MTVYGSFYYVFLLLMLEPKEEEEGEEDEGKREIALSRRKTPLERQSGLTLIQVVVERWCTGHQTLLFAAFDFIF